MLIKKRPSWAMAEADATSEHIYLNRREWLRAAGFAGLGLTTALTGVGGFAAAAVAAIEGYPAPRNICLLYTSPSPRDRTRSRMPSSA